MPNRGNSWESIDPGDLEPSDCIAVDRAQWEQADATIRELQAENERLRKNLAMHETPVLCVVDGWPKCNKAIELLNKAGIDFRVVDVEAALTMDHYGEVPVPPFLRCDCPGGSGLERIEELVKRAVPFVSTGGHR